MKKIFYALVLCMALGTASAQIQMNSVPQTTTVCKGALGWNNLKKTSRGNYFLTLSSDNQFDRVYIIDLGTKEGAIETLSQLLDNFSKDATFNCVDNAKEPFLAMGQSLMGEKRYSIKKAGYGGYAYLRIADIKKFLTALSEE